MRQLRACRSFEMLGPQQNRGGGFTVTKSKPIKASVRRWRERRWKKAQRRREVRDRQPPSGNESRLRAEAEGGWVDRIGYGSGGHP